MNAGLGRCGAVLVRARTMPPATARMDTFLMKTDKKRKHTPAADKTVEAQALADAELCHQALNELRFDFEDVTVVFDANGKLKGVPKECYDSDKGFFRDTKRDNGDVDVVVPHKLFKDLFPEAPETKVTIGDGRALRNGTLAPFYVLQPVDDEGPFLFGPGDDHFDPGSVLREQMDDEDIDDDKEFAWSGSCRYYVKITPELVAWSRTVFTAVELLGDPAHRKTIQAFAARLDAIALPCSTKALEAQDERLKTQQATLPERSVAWHELELLRTLLKHQMGMVRKQVALEQAKVLEEWDAARARMLAPPPTATKPKRRS